MIVATVAIGLLPAVARASTPGDSITLVGPSHPAVIDEAITFTGSGSVVGPAPSDGVYGAGVIYLPASRGILAPSCPADAVSAADSIQTRLHQLPATFSALGSTDPTLVQDGAFTWQATLNVGDPYPDATLSVAGTYDVCAYLYDQVLGTTYAATPTPLVLVVRDPPGSGRRTTAGFGGPGGRPPDGHWLTVRPSRSPLRIPGRNLLHVSGKVDPATAGAVALTVTIKSTRVFNGCAESESVDMQLAQSSGAGGVLALEESVTPSASGAFTVPVELHVTRRPRRGTYIVCAYLSALPQTIAGGNYRFRYPAVSARRRAARATS